MQHEPGWMMEEGFEEAVGKFQDFLETQGRPRQIIWIARDDVIFPGKPFFYVRNPEPHRTEQMARQKYDIAGVKGLGVLLHGFCEVNRAMLCQLWAPTDAGEAERMMMPADGGLKMSIRIEDPTFTAKIVRTRLRWAILKAVYAWNGLNDANSLP